MLETLIYQGFDANGHETIAEEDQSNDECHEQANWKISQAIASRV